MVDWYRRSSDKIKTFSKKDISEGFVPFYINATAGTTVLCAFDSIFDLALICKKNKIWLHLDGAFGGTIIFCY